MHPFKGHADKSGKSKMDGIHKGAPIKTIHNLTDSGPAGGYKKIDGSHSDTMEIKDHPVAMAKGGRSKRSSKHKSPILAPPIPSPDMTSAMPGGGAPPPMPGGGLPGAGGMPGMPMQKRGGSVKRAAGGRIPNAGQATGEARLQQAGIKKRK